jgi:uncharacterized membrane protein
MEACMNSRWNWWDQPLQSLLVSLPIAHAIMVPTAWVIYQVQQDPFWFRLGLVALIVTAALTTIAALPMLADWIFDLSEGTVAWHVNVPYLLLSLGTIGVLIGTAWSSVRYWAGPQPSNVTPALLLALVALGLSLGDSWRGMRTLQRRSVAAPASQPRLLHEREGMRPAA